MLFLTSYTVEHSCWERRPLLRQSCVYDTSQSSSSCTKLFFIQLSCDSVHGPFNLFLTLIYCLQSGLCRDAPSLKLSPINFSAYLPPTKTATRSSRYLYRPEPTKPSSFFSERQPYPRPLLRMQPIPLLLASHVAISTPARNP